MQSIRRQYDLIFSLGEACSCTGSLRESKLQRFSYPFDWLFGSDFDGRCKILLDEFDHFIDKENLEYSYSEKSINCTAYKNSFNDLTFNHDFLTDVDFDEMYILVKEKYDRRIARLLSQIQKSKKILMVYLEIPYHNHKIVNDATLKDNLNKIKLKYTNKIIHILYFANDYSFNPGEFKQYDVTDEIIKVVGNYKDLSKMGGGEEHIVNSHFFKMYFSYYCLKTPFCYKIKRFFLKTMINLNPIKSQRKRMRKRFKI